MSKRFVSLLLGLLLAAFITAAAFLASTYEMANIDANVRLVLPK